MRALATALLLTTVAAGAATGQAASGVRATVRIPPILELTPEGVTDGTGEVRLRVRTNVPWRLTAALPPVGPEESPVRTPVIVDVEGAPASRTLVTPGAPVEVARSAGRGETVVALRVRWAAGSSPAGPSPGEPPRLLYSLDPGG